jgi:acetyl-CoA carboxylase biotin carboxyl carrier protein
VNLEKVKKLIDMISSTDISEIELEDDGSKIRIKRGYQKIEYPVDDIDQDLKVPYKISEVKEEENSNQETVSAPMVGTFYRAPAPDAEPYVEVGDIVNPGDILCIIEAMKLMNEIEVETRGKIVDILVKNGEPVEYGEPLFIIEPL